jgi:thiol-disulfide isomerase/thioredoxin
MVRLIFVSLFLFGSTCHAQQARIVKLADLQQLMSHSDDTLHVINFWATWCGPCVKELPYFEKVAASGVRVTLVSMDLELDPDPKKVYNFIERKGLQSEVVLLDEQDPNTYINKIDQRWSGALPATIIINHSTGQRIFVERSLREGELEQLLSEI